MVLDSETKIIIHHIEPRRGTLKSFKNGGICLLNFVK
jgi:hypothetical protein